MSWSCFHDDEIIISSAPTFHATAAALSALLQHFQWKYDGFQWKYMVLVVKVSGRFYVDLAAYIGFFITSDYHLDIERVVQLNDDSMTSHSVERHLGVIAETAARGAIYQLAPISYRPLSVCLSLTSQYCIETALRFELIFGKQSSLDLSIFHIGYGYVRCGAAPHGAVPDVIVSRRTWRRTVPCRAGSSVHERTFISHCVHLSRKLESVQIRILPHPRDKLWTFRHGQSQVVSTVGRRRCVVYYTRRPDLSLP